MDVNTTKLDYSVPALARMSWPVFIELLLQLLVGNKMCIRDRHMEQRLHKVYLLQAWHSVQIWDF